MRNMTRKDVAEINWKKNARKSPGSNTAYLTFRSSHWRNTCHPAYKTANFVFVQRIAVIWYSAVYTIVMTSCQSTRQYLLFESIHSFVCCSHLESSLRTDFTRNLFAYTCLFSVRGWPLTNNILHNASASNDTKNILLYLMKRADYYS